MKKYKATSPINTINKIRNILTEIGILTKDRHINNKKFFSLRINIVSPDLEIFNYGTNGKGTTVEYAIASAYAEFLERLQNNSLLPKRLYGYRGFLNSLDVNSIYRKKIEENNIVLDFLFDKDEEFWSVDDVLNALDAELHKVYKLEKSDNIRDFFRNIEHSKDGILMVPFYDVQKSSSTMLPIEYIWAATGSNGMCAGNTPKEAILQGICEIFERYALKEIFLREITPPTIPDEEFEGTIAYDNLKYLKEQMGYKVIIKDCSLGIGLPVLGVIISDQKNQFLNFKLGSDFNSTIALERCLNEIHQGTTSFRSLPFKFFDKNSKPNFISEIDYIYENLKCMFVDSTGFWTPALFKSKPSYTFEGFDNNLGKSDDYDYNYCIELIHKLGHNIYIRDNSKLGFPTYYIVIPGMSELIIDKSNPLLLSVTNKINVLSRLKSSTRNEIEDLANVLDKNYDLLLLDKYNYTKVYVPIKDPDLLDLDLELLLFMLFYYLKDYTKAKCYIDKFLIRKSKEEYEYYYAISDFVYLRYEKELDEEEVLEILSIGYTKELASEVIEDLKDPERIFNYYNFPNCFECEKCEVVDKCRLLEVIKLEKQIDIHSRYVNQNKLKEELSININ